METTYYTLATKENFNLSLRHFFKVNEIVDELGSNRNLADVINYQLDSNEMTVDQVLPIVGAVVRDKYNYSFDSYDIAVTATKFDKITNETRKWTAIDIIIIYYNPNGGIVVINPKNPNHWNKARELTKDQMIVIYTKYLKSDDKKKLESEAIRAVEEMITGKDVFINPEFIDQTVVPPKEPVQQKVEAAAPGKVNRTPKYSVQVSNELFPL